MPPRSKIKAKKATKPSSARKTNAKVSKVKKTTNKTGSKMIRQVKTEVTRANTSKPKRTATKTVKKSKTATKTIKKSKTAEKSKTARKNTVTLIRTARTERKRKVIEISKGDFVKNRYVLDSDAYLEYYPRFLTKKKQKDILIELTGSDSLEFDEKKIKKSNLPWQHGYYSMYGKDIPTPRLLYAMRDEDEDITNSYTVTGSMTWTDETEALRDRITKKTGQYCRYAQMNLYRTGDDYIGFHTDSEVESDDMIASVSLGAERTFRFISTGFKDNTKPLYKMTLEPGSLLIMSEYAAKHNWKHELPKDRGVDEMRLNITFRPN
jgi:DNA oxidative demethylase